MQSILDGAGLIQSFVPNCVSAQLAVQRWTGTAWNAPINLTPFINTAELYRSGSSIYLGYQFGGLSRGNVGRLNVP